MNRFVMVLICFSLVSITGFAQVVFEEHFETGTNAPDGWNTKVWGGNGEFKFPVQGKSSQGVQINSTDGGDLSWFKEIEVTPFAQYKLSGWVKTNDVQIDNGAGALLNIHGIDGARTEALVGTNDWKYLETTFNVGERTQIMINCLLGGWGLAKGEAIYDDITLEKISEMAISDTQITIDPTNKGTPINPFIYGQFIEHLGKCIYGGIWAEMLEDRKFFYLINTPDSPWKVYPSSLPVFIDQIKPYTGWYSPYILANEKEQRGLVQDGLTIIAGKEYIGRVILKATHPDLAVTLSLRSGDTPLIDDVKITGITTEYQKFQFRFTAKHAADSAQFYILTQGIGNLFIGAVSLMPGDNIKGMRADTLALIKELNSPIYRWPGGNFVSGYNWKDGIGDPDKRPTRKNPAWGGIDTNDFGMDEFMQFCREINAEPYMVVNSGLGDVQLATEMLEYANGSTETPMGKWRANNGHPEPYKVVYWSIGNEMYGQWQLGYLPLKDYINKHNEFAEAMRKVDPNIKIVAVGDSSSPWSKGMLENCAQNMDLLSEHFYCSEKKDVLEHVRQIAEQIKRKVKEHKKYYETLPSLKDKFIPIALDEWNYWYGEPVYGEIGCAYRLKDALGVAIGLHEFFRNSDVITMANYAQTVNVIGAIKTTKTTAFFDTTGLTLKLYRQCFGTVPVSVELKPVADASSQTSQQPATAAPIDVFCSWKDEASGILVLSIVNPLSRDLAVHVDMIDQKAITPEHAWIITGKEPMSIIQPGKEPDVWLAEAQINLSEFPRLVIPPISVFMIELKVNQ
ncbi:MAG TPA: alpha-L-arabinofuranosidase C-terminal domain-containing protein [Candidatus Hydrogenedens sp.]|nr:alpha-L-arabinofuranosidase C-terminal domain-containing protein [Candidatus Hydrogenedens sp.]